MIVFYFSKKKHQVIWSRKPELTMWQQLSLKERSGSLRETCSVQPAAWKEVRDTSTNTLHHQTIEPPRWPPPEPVNDHSLYSCSRSRTSWQERPPTLHSHQHVTLTSHWHHSFYLHLTHTLSRWCRCHDYFESIIWVLLHSVAAFTLNTEPEAAPPHTHCSVPINTMTAVHECVWSYC